MGYLNSSFLRLFHECSVPRGVYHVPRSAGLTLIRTLEHNVAVIFFNFLYKGSEQTSVISLCSTADVGVVKSKLK